MRTSAFFFFSCVWNAKNCSTHWDFFFFNVVYHSSKYLDHCHHITSSINFLKWLYLDIIILLHLTKRHITFFEQVRNICVEKQLYIGQNIYMHIAQYTYPTQENFNCIHILAPSKRFFLHNEEVYTYKLLAKKKRVLSNNRRTFKTSLRAGSVSKGVCCKSTCRIAVFNAFRPLCGVLIGWAHTHCAITHIHSSTDSMRFHTHFFFPSTLYGWMCVREKWSDPFFLKKCVMHKIDMPILDTHNMEWRYTYIYIYILSSKKIQKYKNIIPFSNARHDARANLACSNMCPVLSNSLSSQSKQFDC